MRTDVRIDLYSDEEGLYQAKVTLPDGTELVVDPRFVIEHSTSQ